MRVLRLTLDQDQVQRELAAMEFPADLKFGFVVLVIFAVLGVVLPIILMATQPDDLSVLWRIVVVGGFLLGLVGLGVFLDSITGTERWSWLRERFYKPVEGRRSRGAMKDTFHADRGPAERGQG
jgi:hypothetical protein